jgi:hypothetical protein
MSTYKINAVQELLSEKQNINDKIEKFLKQFTGKFENFSTRALINSNSDFLLVISNGNVGITLNLTDIEHLSKILNEIVNTHETKDSEEKSENQIIIKKNKKENN